MRPAGLIKASVAPGSLLLCALLGLWVVWFPPSPDLAAQEYRTHLFSSGGFALWDNGWYGGHYLLGYSLLAPALGSLLGLRLLGVLSVAASTLLFSRLIEGHLRVRPRLACLLFALAASGDLFIGRITFAVGVSFGLAAALASARGRNGLAAPLSLACACASPVCALFLALAACSDLLANRVFVRPLALAGPALALVLTLALLFPEGGYELFSWTSLLAAGGLCGAVGLLLPREASLLRWGLGLYLLALLLSFSVRSPMGSNAVRLGVLFSSATLVGAVGAEDARKALFALFALVKRGRLRAGVGASGGVHGVVDLRWGRAALVVLAIGLVLWQIDGPVAQSVQAANDPSTSLSYYVPAIRYLRTRANGAPMRIEVPFTASHWDAVILGERFLLARGWERQLDTRYDSLFYAPFLSASAYRSWLRENAVRFVLLPDAALDFSSVKEGVLVRRGLPFLREVYRSAHWRIYAVVDARPLASGPGGLVAVGGQSFTLRCSAPGSFLVRIHYTPFWQVSAGEGSVSEAEGGWTLVRARTAGRLTVEAQL